MESAEIQLGSTAKDVITGFVGIVTGRAEYISGCSQALLIPQVDSAGKYSEGQWFDEQRLVVNERVPVVVLNNGDTPGSDKEAPKR